MAEKKRVFYSWQSDLDNRTNRGFIRKALERAVDKEAITDAERDFEIDSDTQGVPGAPDIKQVILDKIETTTIFVADVSLINSGSEKRPLTPNPNVMLELGYALRAIGSKRVILVFNAATGRVDDLPFDIKTQRPLVYHADPGADDLPTERNSLAKSLARAIAEINASLVTALPPSRLDTLLSAEDPNRFADLVGEALSAGDRATIRDYLEDAVESVRAALVDTRPEIERFGSATGTMDRVTAVGVEAIRREDDALLASVADALRRIYECGFDIPLLKSDDTTDLSQKNFGLEVAVRVLALGAFGARAGRLEIISPLARQVPRHQYRLTVANEVPWLRHVLGFGTEPVELLESCRAWVGRAKPLVPRLGQPLPQPLYDFDVFAALSVWRWRGRLDSSIAYSGAMAKGAPAIEPALLELVRSKANRGRLGEEQIDDAFLASAIRQIATWASERHREAWHGWTSPEIIDFLAATPSLAVVAKPYVVGARESVGLRFRLFNSGRESVHLLSVEVDVPNDIISNALNWVGDASMITHHGVVIDDVGYTRARFATYDGPVDTMEHGEPRRLPRELAPGESVHLWHLRCGLVPGFRKRANSLAITSRVYVSGRDPFVGRWSIAELEESSEEGSSVRP